MFHTKLCDILNIKYPIIQGGMAWVATAELAVAVSEAGGLGIIAAGNAPAEVVLKEIKKAKKMTNKPFGVNVMLLSPFIDEVIEVVLAERVSVITTGAGNPSKYIKQFQEIGTKVIPVVPSIALAKRMEKLGADAVIVEGTEAGGHIGELTTMVLVPQIASEIKIPVIAAGGIADGRGFLAALSLGADGVQIGTMFICSTECTAHEKYKQKLLRAKDRDAIVTARVSGHPVRVLKNKFAKELMKLEEEGITKKELEEIGAGKLRLAAVDGDVDNGSVMAGQIAGMIKNIKPCKELIEGIIIEAKTRLDSLSKFC
ncbi:MAG: enoyl-[acyl-carrier-protein] reductase FabK [Alkaliphilus sp.]|nr:MAG: enoyl-[acyl-carrier-protein] reductase FabK [Alkaliphilus sp.]